MKYINCFGLCDVLSISKQNFEARIASLAHILTNDPEFKDLPSSKNCLRVMKTVGLGYGLRQESVYLAATSLIINMETLIIRLLGRPSLNGYSKMIQRADLENIINASAGLHYVKKVHKSIDQDEAMVCIASHFTSFLLEAIYSQQREQIVKYLSDPSSVSSLLSSFPSITSTDLKILKAWVSESLKRNPQLLEFKENEESFRRLISYISHRYLGYDPGSPVAAEGEQQDCRRLIKNICRSRNSIVHEGKIVLEENYATNALESAFTYLSLATSSEYRRTRRTKIVDRIVYGLLNPLRAIVLLWHSYLRYAVYILMALSVIWGLAPISMVEKVFFENFDNGGSMERLYESLVKKDTAAVLELHREAKIINETMDAINQY